jgi:arylformamidase
MSFDWRRQTDDVLARHYSPRLAVGDAAANEMIAAYAADSAAVRERIEGRYDLRYGAGPKCTLDVHPGRGDGPRPVLFFIHGGFWRALDKSDHTFVAPAYMDAGVTVVNVNYDLCPSVTLDDIVSEIRQALAFTWRNAAEWGGDRERITIAGHSAGGHLCGMLLNHDWAAAGLAANPIRSAAPLSGIFEPGVVLHIAINDEVHLDEAMAARNDCVAQPPQCKVPVLIAAGGDEPEGWREQSRAYARVCADAGCRVRDIDVPGTNHFSLLRDAADPHARLFGELIALIGA